MNAVTEKRATLAGAIAEFDAAERQYEVARDAAATAEAAVHDALERDASIFPLIEARLAAGNAFSRAGKKAWGAGQHVVKCANEVIRHAAGDSVLVAIDDIGNLEAAVVAWRNCRNALIKDAGTPLAIVGG